MRAVERRMGLAFAAIADAPYGVCEGHHPYATKVGARRAGRAHVRGWRRGDFRCRKCRSGLVPDVFKCVHHWHWGHGRPGRIEMADQQAEIEGQPPLGDDQYNGLVETTEAHIDGLVGVVGLFSQRLAISEAVRRGDGKALRRLRDAYRKLAREAQRLAEQCDA